MKTKLLTIACIAALLLAVTDQARAEGPLEVAADVLLVRPACFAATVVGSALFVVALPFAAMSKSIKPTAQTLIVQPAQATFTRPVGDVDSLQDY